MVKNDADFDQASSPADYLYVLVNGFFITFDESLRDALRFN